MTRMVVVGGVRYRLEDADRLGLLEGRPSGVTKQGGTAASPAENTGAKAKTGAAAKKKKK